MLANLYHLALRPGIDTVERLGGLHAFTGWSGPILTDSGGYQVFSLAERCRITEDGAEFQSHIDGSSRRLTPESAVDIQARLGSDIIPDAECNQSNGDDHRHKVAGDDIRQFLDRRP